MERLPNWSCILTNNYFSRSSKNKKANLPRQLHLTKAKSFTAKGVSSVVSPNDVSKLSHQTTFRDVSHLSHEKTLHRANTVQCLEGSKASPVKISLSNNALDRIDQELGEILIFKSFEKTGNLCSQVKETKIPYFRYTKYSQKIKIFHILSIRKTKMTR